MRTIKLTIEYDGTAYCGWQRQPNALSIQEVVEKAVRGMTGEMGDVIGASRTDAGVHAFGQVAHFTTEAIIPCDGFLRGLNSILPEDIRIVRLEEARGGFHARKCALHKTYRYLIGLGPVASALERNRSWQLRGELDVEAMRGAAAVLIGKNDFAAFMASGCGAAHAVRTITSITIAEIGQRREISVEVTGDGFVRHMVRNMVGLMVEAGQGKRSAEDVKRILEGAERSEAGVCAPASGLYLVSIAY